SAPNGSEFRIRQGETVLFVFTVIDSLCHLDSSEPGDREDHEVLSCTPLPRGWDPICEGEYQGVITSQEAMVLTSGQTWRVDHITFRVQSDCVLVIPLYAGDVTLNFADGRSQTLRAVENWSLAAPTRCMIDREHRS